MSKEQKISDIKIVDMQENTAIEYRATKEPKKSTLGNSYFGTLSSKGIAKLQQMGYDVVDEDAWCNLLRATYGLTEDELGNRGVRWDNIDARNRYKVFVDDILYEPEYTEKQKARIENTETPVPRIPQIPPMMSPQVPRIVVPPMPSVADTTQVFIPTPQIVVPQIPKAIVPQIPQVPQMKPSVPQGLNPLSAEDISYIQKMKYNLSLNKWSKEVLLSSLAEKIGVDRAKRILSLSL